MMKPPCPSRKATAFWRSNYTASNSAATLNLQLALDGCSAARAPGVWPASATVPKSAYSMESNVVNTIAYYGLYIYMMTQGYQSAASIGIFAVQSFQCSSSATMSNVAQPRACAAATFTSADGRLEPKIDVSICTVTMQYTKLTYDCTPFHTFRHIF